MASLYKFLFSLILIIPFAAGAGVVAEDLPGGTIWYLHANLAQLRNTASAKPLYDWIDGEVFAEIRDEVGIDINKEVDSVTAFSSTDHNTVIVVDGNISQDTQDKMLAIAVLKGKLETLEHEGNTYYRVWDADQGNSENHKWKDDDDQSPLQDFDGEAFFGFVANSKLVVTSKERELRSMLENHGAIAGSGSHENALFVLTADKTFVQAGLKTDRLSGDEDWQSNIISNTKEAALLISGINDLIAIEAQLVSTEAAMARSIGGIVNGLIGLQSFNTELDPEIRSMLENTKVKVDNNVLSIATVVDPALIVNVLDD